VLDLFRGDDDQTRSLGDWKLAISQFTTLRRFGKRNCGNFSFKERGGEKKESRKLGLGSENKKYKKKNGSYRVSH